MIAGLPGKRPVRAKKKPGQGPACANWDGTGYLPERAQGLDLSVGVGADFAVQVDLFVLRCGPFHGRLLRIRSSRHEHSTINRRRREQNFRRPVQLRDQKMRGEVRGKTTAKSSKFARRKAQAVAVDRRRSAQNIFAKNIREKSRFRLTSTGTCLRCGQKWWKVVSNG